MSEADLLPGMDFFRKPKYPAFARVLFWGILAWIATLVGTITADRLNQNLSSQVEVEYTCSFKSAYWVHSEIAPMVSLSIGGQKAQTLMVLEMRIHNRSTKALENVKMKIDFGPSAPKAIRKVLDIPPDYDKEWLSWENADDLTNTSFEIKSLNVTDEYKPNVTVRFFFDRGFEPIPLVKTPNAGVVFVPLRSEPPKSSPMLGWDRYVYPVGLGVLGLAGLCVVVSTWRNLKLLAFARVFKKGLASFVARSPNKSLDQAREEVEKIGNRTASYTLKRWRMAESADKEMDAGS